MLFLLFLEERQEENIIQLLDKKLHVARDAISSELECVICKGPFIEVTNFIVYLYVLRNAFTIKDFTWSIMLLKS